MLTEWHLPYETSILFSSLLLSLLVSPAAICVYAQHPRTAALTETETEQVREAAVYPE
jgi:hypothetical protein